MGGGGAPTLNQAHFRFANNDNATIGSVSFAAAEDTAIELPLDTPIILWVAIGNSGSKAASNISFELNANVDGGGAQRVGAATSNGIRSVNGQPADDASITANRLTAPQTTFVSGFYDEGGGDQPMSNVSLDIDQYTNVAFCFEADSAVLSGGESVTLTVTYDTGTALDNYTQTITLTTKATLQGSTSIDFPASGTLTGLGALAANVNGFAFDLSATPTLPSLVEETQTGEATSSTTVTTGAAITAEADKTYVVFIAARLLPTISSLTDSTSGLTWTLRDTQGGGRGQQTLYCYTSSGTPSADFTVTATFTGTVAGLAIWIGKFAATGVGSIDSYNTNGQNGATSGGTDSDMGSDESYTHTTTEADSILVLGSSHRVESATPESSFEEFDDFHGGPATGDQQGLAAAGRSAATATGYTVYNTYTGAVDWSVISIELLTGLDGAIASDTVGLAFSASGTLTARGELAASADALAFSSTADLRGRASIAATTSIDFADTATLTGRAALAADASALAFSATATLTGRGALAATPSIDFADTATLTGAGALSASASIDFAATGTMGAPGAMFADVVGIAFDSVAALTGRGELAASAGIAFSATGTLTGRGTLAADASVAFDSVAALTGTGALSATASIDFSATGTMLLDGQIAATAVGLAFSSTAALTGRGALAGTATIAFSATGSTGSVGALAANVTALSFSAEATGTAKGYISGSAGISFSQIANIRGRGALSASRSITFTASGTISARAAIAALATVSFSAVGQLRDAAAAITRRKRVRAGLTSFVNRVRAESGRLRARAIGTGKRTGGNDD